MAFRLPNTPVTRTWICRFWVYISSKQALPLGLRFPTETASEGIYSILKVSFPYASSKQHGADLGDFAPYQIEASVNLDSSHVWQISVLDKRKKLSALFSSTDPESRSDFDQFLQCERRVNLRRRMEQIIR